MSADDPWGERRDAIRARVLRARAYRERLDRAEVSSQAELAQVEGLTPARVSQLLALLKLNPQILAELEDEEVEGPLPSEPALRRIAGVRPPEEQRYRFRRLCREAGAAKPSQHRPRPESGVRRRGLQHLFDQARRWQEALDRGEARSLAEIGRQEGITGSRVAQVVMLLHLHPDIIARMDVPAGERPKGITSRQLRSLARVGDVEEQLRRFDEMVVAGRRSAGAHDSRSTTPQTQSLGSIPYRQLLVDPGVPNSS
ncbi:MAG: hypothetical protein H6739_37805 [Alphaproteobacteria bacterium]|nr:hypothetical protein [Alphaproteobacteria bacterium]